MPWPPLLIGLAVGLVIALPLVWLLVKRQTTRARTAERRARTAERLAEIGAMTSGLAHEIKNPLSTIGLNAQLLAEAIEDLDLPDDEHQRLQRRIATLRRETDRLADTLADFLRFAGEIRLDQRMVDLNEIVEELIDFYLPQADHHGILLRAELAPMPMPASVDVALLKQAVLNLMLNATQAMGSSPAGRPRELILRTTPAPGPSTGGPAPRTWEIHVIDTGPGIPADVQASIFTPYFTTKPSGSGLGLPTTRRIIDEHGGEIEVHSQMDLGTDFTIRLPAG